MAPWRVGPSLALAVVLAAAVAPASRWSGDKANEIRRSEAVARPHTIQIIRGVPRPAPRPRPPSDKPVAYLAVGPAAVPWVEVVGCGVMAAFRPGTNVDLRVEELPCTLTPSVKAGGLRAEGVSVTVQPGHERVTLEVPAWVPGGAGMSVSHGEPVIVGVLPGRPADRAGLVRLDRVVAIDGRSTDGIDGDEFVRRLVGPVGEPVTLTIARGEARFDVTIVREEIDWPAGRVPAAD